MSGWTAGDHADVAFVRLRFSRAASGTRSWQRWVKHWAGGLLAVFGIEQHWAGALQAPRTAQARLVVAITARRSTSCSMLERFGGSVLARHDLERWPCRLGRAATGGTIFVDRRTRRAASSAIREIRSRLQAGGRP